MFGLKNITIDKDYEINENWRHGYQTHSQNFGDQSFIVN